LVRLVRKHPVTPSTLALASDDDTLNTLPLSYPFGTDQQSNTLTLIHDAFQPLSYWNDFMPREKFPGAAMDTHIYQMFSVGVCSMPLKYQATA